MSSEQDQNDTVSRILDAAEARIRLHGFNAFSFRDIAADVGIKSASVHYHFPTKADLGEAVLSRYSQRINASLCDLKDKNLKAEEMLARYISSYEQLLQQDNAKCLAGVLAAEQASLPEELGIAVKQYFENQLEWLKTVFQKRYPEDKKKKAKARAQQLLASLQGGVLIAHTLGDKKLLERSYKGLL